MQATSALLLLMVVGCLSREITRENEGSRLARFLHVGHCYCSHGCQCQQGYCQNNQCHCYTGWAGPDCGEPAWMVHETTTVARVTSPAHTAPTTQPSAVGVTNTHHDCRENHGYFDGTKCVCPVGWTGEICQHIPNTKHECYDPSCQHGICLWWLDEFGHRHQECHCDDEYTGDNCAYTDHPNGDTYPCHDQSLCEHGTCLHNTAYSPYDYYACQCEGGWHGERCDENHPAPETIMCGDKVCRHGTCHKEHYSQSHQTYYQCKCDVGWVDEHCDTEKYYQCSHSLNCLHGICYYNQQYAGGPKYNHKCVCTDGWYGTSCDHHISGLQSTTTPTTTPLPTTATPTTTSTTPTTTPLPTTTTPSTTTTTPTTTTTTPTTTTTTPTTTTTTPTTTTTTPLPTTTTPLPTTTTPIPTTTTPIPTTTTSLPTTPTTTMQTTTRMVFTATTAPHPSNPVVTAITTSPHPSNPVVTATTSPAAGSTTTLFQLTMAPQTMDGNITTTTRTYKACDSSVMMNLHGAVHANEPTAQQCPSGQHESSEALVIRNCNVDVDPSTWGKDDSVVTLCNQGVAIPWYTPIATFDHGVYSSTGGRSGIFLGCISNGFQMVFQTCNSPPHIAAITQGGAYIQDPNMYFIIQ